MTKELCLIGGSTTLVDDDDFEWLSQWRWAYIADPGYVARSTKVGGKSVRIYIHRAILNAPKGILVDHKDRNVLNNQKSNLRFATRRQNAQNAAAPKGILKSSKYKGVTWSKQRQRWAAQLKLNRKHIFLGYHNDELSAAHAYDIGAICHYGEFAYLNFTTEKQ